MKIAGSSTFVRIARREIWGLPLLFMTGGLFALLSFLFDAVLLNDWSPYWILIGVVSFGEVVVLGWAFRTLILNRFGFESALLNLGVAGVLGMIKNVSVAVLAAGLGLNHEPLYAFRFAGGFALGVGLFWFAGLALGARTEHTAIMAQLTQVQAALLSLRNSSKARLAMANERLAKQTRELLVPKLDQLQELVTAVGGTRVADSGGALEGLRVLIREDVRPLSEALSSQALALADEPVDLAPPVKRYRLFQPQIELRGLIRPNAAFISLAFSSLMIAYIIIGAPRCNKAFYLSVVSWGLAWLAKSLVPAGLKVSRRMAIWSLFVIGTAMAVPPYIASIVEIRHPNEPWLLILIWPAALVSLMAFGFSESLDRDRVAARAHFEAENRNLAHDQALFERQLWLERRAWQFVVHGTVQAALTAALTRLQASPEPEQYVLNMVAEDIARARRALADTPVRRIDLADSFAQMQATWRGICDIKISVTDRAGRSLQKNNDACVCVNEIVKETVSNAVRHGEAKNILVEVDREDDFNLTIVVSNDGLPLKAQAHQMGVGSRLIEELTTDWSIESHKGTGLTVFQANLPLQRRWG